jgi:UDP-glucose 4-epimerase
MRILVTGGAGYIGSHMVRALLEAGHGVVVVDDLSAGHRDAVPDAATFVQADVGDTPVLTSLLRDGPVDAVLHFAGRIRVDESVTDPRVYYEGNVVRSLRLLDAVLAAETPLFVFSSTAAVYGDPETIPIPESHPLRPVNPYGDSKLAVERVLHAYGKAYGLRWAALRYFNAAGALPGLAERHEPETHLIPLILDAALGKRPSISIFGTDWPTPDGTCVRDFIHVRDLATAHLAAVEHLRKGGESGAFNLGTGRGHSVREVIATTKSITGRDIRVVEATARAGDPPTLVAGVARANEVLGWTAEHSSLSTIIDDAWRERRRAP